MPTFSGPTNIPPWEAFKMGIPAIYSDIFGIREVYKEAVYYIDPFNSKTMVKAVNDIMENPEVKKRLIDNGKKLLKENNFDKDVEQILNIVEKNSKIKNSWLFKN